VPIFTLLVGFTSATIIDIPADQPRFLDGSNVGAVQYVCDSLVRVFLDIPPNLYSDSVITIELERVTGDVVALASLRIHQFEYEENGQPGGGAQSSGLLRLPLPRVDLKVQPSIFRDGTKLHLALPQECDVELQIYDITGRKVRTLLDGTMASGGHVLDYQGHSDNDKRLPNGVYFAQLRALDIVITRKLLMIR
jgi:hypothetical protein